MTLALQAGIEGFFAGVCAGAIITWFYNRLLADLRESTFKKLVALGVPPISAALGIGHGVAVWLEWPHLHFPVYLGVLFFLIKIHSFTRRVWLNRNLTKSALPLTASPINYDHFPSIVATGLCAAPFNDVKRLQLVQREVVLPNLHQDMDGYRIVFLTDFHVHPTLTKTYYSEVIEHALALEPDAIFLGGDNVSKRQHIDRAREYLAPLAKHPRLVAVRGNHDFWTRPSPHLQLLKELGAEVLSNEATVLARGGGALVIAGFEDPYLALTARGKKRLKDQVEELRTNHKNAPLIGLVHTPLAYRHVAELGCSMAMAGHTHGGQIRLPFFGTTVASCSQKEERVWGEGRYGQMITLTSNGIGAFFPVRFMCPPQIIEMTFRVANSNN